MDEDENPMASNLKISLSDAISAMEKAYASLSAATDIALHERAETARARSEAEQELSRGWQAHTEALETTCTQLTSENDFLKADNLRLSNQLQALQRDYLELQRSAGDVIGSLDRSVRQLDLILEH
jgi:hypothetical protein